MAQFVLQDLVNRAGYTDNFYIDSMATSTEEIGNGPHHGTVAKLRQVGVPVLEHYAKQVRKSVTATLIISSEWINGTTAI